MTIIWTLHKVSAIYLHLPRIRALYISFISKNLTRCIKYTQLFIIRVVASGTSHPRSGAFKTTRPCEIFVILWTAIRLMSTSVMDISAVETEMKWVATAAICPLLSNCHWWVSCYWCWPCWGKSERERERERERENEREREEEEEEVEGWLVNLWPQKKEAVVIVLSGPFPWQQRVVL